MLAIKLQRIGKRGQPAYRLVVAEKRSKLIAPPVEDLGSYSSFTKLANLNAERVKYWIGKGAQPTPTVHNLLVKSGIIQAPKVSLRIKAAPKAEAPAEAVAAPAEVPQS